MNKKARKSKRSKLAGQPIKAISSPIIPDSASVKSETIPIKLDQKLRQIAEFLEKMEPIPCQLLVFILIQY